MAHVHQIYSDEWRALGVVTTAEMAEDAAQLSIGEDPHPEHYRWRRFLKFVHAHPAIDPMLASSLYALGESDADSALGESMMALVLRRSDCPLEIHEKAMTSMSDHLRRIASARLNEKRG
jgi:hypothetical protein